MANLDFFAVHDDHRALFDFLFAETDVRVFESYSEFDRPLREFRSFADLEAAFDVGKDKHGNGTAALLELWSPSSCKKPKVERIELDPKKHGASFRFRLEGWALMQLYLGGVHKKMITKSHFGHNSPTRAKNWGHGGGIDWKALAIASNKIQYAIRSRLAVARAPGRPILPAAYELATKGHRLVEYARSPVVYELPPRKKPRIRAS